MGGFLLFTRRQKTINSVFHLAFLRVILIPYLQNLTYLCFIKLIKK